MRCMSVTQPACLLTMGGRRVDDDGSFVSWGATFPTAFRCTPCAQKQAIKARNEAAAAAKAAGTNWQAQFQLDDEWDGEIIEVD